MARFIRPFRVSRSKPLPTGLETLATIVVLAVLLTAGQVYLQAQIVQAQTVAADRAALVALYDAAGGDSWTNNDGWKSDQPLGDWNGVTTDSDGRVTILALNGNNLTGPIPAELGNLGELTDIAFYDNQLTGLIPPELGKLNHLVSLLLHNNSLMGNVPPELSQLSSMTTMSIDRNQLTGPLPYSFTGLSSLTQFRFRDNAGLCAPLDSDFQTWLNRVSIRQGDNCPPTRIRSGAPVAVVGEPVTARLTSREARLARIQAMQQEYDNNPCIGYDASRNLNSPWSWERAEANSNDPGLPDGNTWTRLPPGNTPTPPSSICPRPGMLASSCGPPCPTTARRLPPKPSGR